MPTSFSVSLASSRRAVHYVAFDLDDTTARLGEVDDGASWAGTRPHFIHFRSVNQHQAEGGMQNTRDNPIPVMAGNGQLDRAFPEAVRLMKQAAVR